MKRTQQIWHPFTQMQTAPPPLPVVRGEGAYLELEDGRKILDCISSWWVTLHGHANKRIADAIHEQACKLEQVIFAGFTHEPAEQITALLLEKLPSRLRRVFFSDNGSTSVEVAIKMAFQYWQNIGQPQRKRFIGFDGGYHGDTVGAMSAGGSSSFWRTYKDLMFAIDTVEFPATWEGDPQSLAKEERTLAALRQLFSKQANEYCGVIIEPLIQGAAGMRMCSVSFLQKLRKLCDEFDTLLIFDEVMTGFGRTGDWFACTKSSAEPDIICLSKGITGGFLPLAVTVASDKIYEAFLSPDLHKALFHSHSYTANPIACAAAVASMHLLNETSQLFLGMEKMHRQLSAELLLPSGLFNNARYCGTIFACDIKDEQADYYSDIAPKLRAKFIDRGFLLRPLGTTIYLMPPLCIDEPALRALYKSIVEVVSELRQPATANN